MPSIVKNVVNWGANLRSSTNSPANGAPAVPAPMIQSDLCEICGKKPKFVDKGFKHPYCSRSCARNGVGNPSPKACLLRGCRATGKPAFASFCSDAHAREGVRTGKAPGCSQCKVQPRGVSNLCIPCERQMRGIPRLRELMPDSASFKAVRAQFLSEWESGTSSATVQKVYEVIMPREHRVSYDQYRTSNRHMTEVRTFHSSQCICDLGFKDSDLCTFKSCGICCTVKSSFAAFAFGVSSNKGRFGDGVYSYRNPAQADRFATSCTSSPYRVMIACDSCVEPGQLSNGEKESLFNPASNGIVPAYVIMYTR